DPFAVAVVAIGVNKDTTAGVGGAKAAGFTAETAEDDRVNDAEPSTSEHRNRELENHRHVNGDAISGFESAEVAEHRSGFVHADVELAIGNYLGRLVFWLRNENECGFVFVFGEMTINTVIRGVELAADEPFPEGRLRGV